MTNQSETHHQVNMLNEDFNYLKKIKEKWQRKHPGSTWKYGKIIATLCQKELKN
tara:strand:+ start:5860 stop:6021 length:162 start_codon:yes stop_codon:yes gene_type:complete